MTLATKLRQISDKHKIDRSYINVEEEERKLERGISMSESF